MNSCSAQRRSIAYFSNAPVGKYFIWNRSIRNGLGIYMPFSKLVIDLDYVIYKQFLALPDT